MKTAKAILEAFVILGALVGLVIAMGEKAAHSQTGTVANVTAGEPVSTDANSIITFGHRFPIPFTLYDAAWKPLATCEQPSFDSLANCKLADGATLTDVLNAMNKAIDAEREHGHNRFTDLQTRCVDALESDLKTFREIQHRLHQLHSDLGASKKSGAKP